MYAQGLVHETGTLATSTYGYEGGQIDSFLLTKFPFRFMNMTKASI